MSNNLVRMLTVARAFDVAKPNFPKFATHIFAVS